MTKQEKKYERLIKKIVDAKGELNCALDDGTAVRPAEIQKYYDRASDKVSDGDLELDPCATVSLSEDDGAYVEMWKWVENRD